MKLKENQPKKKKKRKEKYNAKSGYRTRLAKTQKMKKSQVINPFGHRAADISECYNLYSTSEPVKLVAWKQRREIL